MSSTQDNNPVGWTVYLIECNDGTLYCGCAKDLKARLLVHQSGKGSRYVRSRLPFRLRYAEQQKNRSKAQKREAEIKKYTRLEKLAICKWWEQSENDQ